MSFLKRKLFFFLIFKFQQERENEDNNQITCTSLDLDKNTCKVSKRSGYNCRSCFSFNKQPNVYMGKFKKNVTVQFFYPHALNMEYFYLNLSLKGVF